MGIDLLLGTPAQAAGVAQSLTDFAGNNDVKLARFVFAYASLAGLRDCLREAQDDLRSARKNWVVGLHLGITEPAALREICATPHSELRLFCPTSKLDSAALYSSEKLHAKAIQVVAPNSSLLIIGSANLTRAALGTSATNFEACIGSTTTSKKSSEHKAFAPWFLNLWTQSLPATTARIDRYAIVREKLIDANPVILPSLDEYPSSEIDHAQNLWIEAGAMSGQDSNQVEFGPKLAPFFGPSKKGTKLLRVKFGSILRDDRPLSYKVTQWNTEIWRLSLITSPQGGPSYPGRVIHLARTRDDHGEFFLMHVADAGSIQSNKWKRLAHATGTVARTGSAAGGRTYGVY
jgi:hypothetical protein